jgi:hypothetical protein
MDHSLTKEFQGTENRAKILFGRCNSICGKR